MMSEIDRVAPLIKRARKQQERIERLEADLKTAKRELRHILDVEIPELMNELGLSEVKTADGLEVQVAPVVYAHITEDKRQAAHAWLRQHGYGDLIKHQVTASFGAGEDDMAYAVKHHLEGLGVAVQDKESVHHSTLRAWARERLEAGDDIPEDLFGLSTGMTTKIKEAK